MFLLVLNPPLSRGWILLIFGRRRVAVARYRMICLVLAIHICYFTDSVNYTKIHVDCNHRALGFSSSLALGSVCYYAVTEATMNWSSAKKACALRGSTLACLPSASHQEHVYEYMRKIDDLASPYWIGLSRSSSDNHRPFGNYMFSQFYTYLIAYWHNMSVFNSWDLTLTNINAKMCVLLITQFLQ